MRCLSMHAGPGLGCRVSPEESCSHLYSQLLMLAADKLLLQSNVKQRSIELREKELKLFNQNFSAICTQSAIMAGFTLTTFVEIDLPPEKQLAKVSAACSAPSPHCLPMWTVAADRTRPALRRRCCTSS